ncbi:MAG: hypothetical protein EOO93_24330 [Pedobacter sp.]|nr:MAG: hypothetical protein EOO93_24330 [Pedobacter sp.]
MFLKKGVICFGVKVAVNGGYLHLLEIQLEGKKRMPVTEFLKGFQPKEFIFQ